MARVPFIEYEEASPALQGLYERIEQAMGRVSNNAKMLAHTPHILPFHFAMILAVKYADTGLLDARLKNLIILRVSAVHECDYCIHHNTQFGAAAGSADDQMHAITRDDWHERADLFSEREIAAIRWAEAVGRNQARRDMTAFADVSAHFSPAEIVEIAYVAAHRTMVNLLQEALWNDLEPEGTPAHDRPEIPDGFWDDYFGQVVPDVLAENASRRNGAAS